MKTTTTFLVFGIMTLTSCGSVQSPAQDQQPAVIPAVAITLSSSSLSLRGSRSVQLSAVTTPANAPVTWTSSNPAIAVVDKGLVTTVGLGTTVITATGTGTTLSAQCSVTTKPYIIVAPYSVKLDLTQKTSQTVTAAVFPTTAPISWSSSNSTVATVTGTGASGTISKAGTTTGSSLVTATITAGGETVKYQVSVTVAASQSPMALGINFWNKHWQSDETYFKLGITASNWSSSTLITTSVPHLASFNPWQPQLLTDLAAFNGPIRFMDFDNANTNPIEHWSDRIKMTDSQYGSATTSIPLASYLRQISDYAYYRDNAALSMSNLSYEWMIDLCNRTGRDMWVNVPAFADEVYITNLATLIRDHLKPGLKVYVEYSNEFWNWISSAMWYSQKVGPTGDSFSESSGVVGALPGPNKYYQGAAWCTLRALQVWKTFSTVFGMENIGLDKTVIRVLAFSGNSDLASESLSKVIFQGSSSVLNTTWNGKYQQKPDVLAVGPYVGPNDDALMYQRWLETGENQTIYPKLDGAAADIKARYRANTDTCLTFYLQNFKQIAGTFGLPLVGYEGGQQMDTNADQWATNPAMYDEYLYFFDQVNEAGLILLNQYTLYSAFQSNQAQGLAPGPTAGPENTYPKFKAVKDWMHTRWASAGY